MVSTTSRGHRWRLAPLLLLLSSTVYAQYTPRGRVVQNHSITRRAETSPASQDAPAETGASTGSPSDDGAGSEEDENANGSATEKQEGNEGNEDSSQGEHDGDGDGKNDLYLISHEDFCIYGPAEAGIPIAHAGENVVSWCTKDHGAKVIPEGTLTGVTYVKTPNYAQVSGSGHFQNIDIAPNDSGGQLDSSDHTPSGAQLFLGSDQTAASSWVTIIGPETFCVRACTGDPQYCPTQYDEKGCYFLTQNGVGWPDVFQDCEGEDGDIPGTSQNEDDLKAPAVSNCQSGGSLGAQATANSSKASSKSEATSSGSHSASAGTLGSMVPLETCVPCSEASSAAALHNTNSGDSPTTASPALSGTTEVAVSKIQSDGTLVDGATAIANKPTEAPKSEGALVQKRQDEGSEGGQDEDEASASPSQMDDGKIKTRGDQCCFTIWSDSTSTAVSGAGAAKSTGTASGTGAGAGVGNSTDPFRGLSGTATAHATAAGGINGSAHGANDTGNSSDSGAGSWRTDVFGVKGIGRILGALSLGMIGGGWLLL